MARSMEIESRWFDESRSDEIQETLADPMHLARSFEHFTTNLAIAGALLFLPLRGSGRFTLDRLMKKND